MQPANNTGSTCQNRQWDAIMNYFPTGGKTDDVKLTAKVNKCWRMLFFSVFSNEGHSRCGTFD